MEYPLPSSLGLTTATDDRFGKLFQLLKDQTVSQLQAYNPANVDKSSYDGDKKLGDVSNTSLDGSKDSKNARAFSSRQQQHQRRIADAKNESDNTANNVNSQDSDEGGILSMIFNIVPIGINIVKKGDTIAAGLQEIPMGIGELIANLAVMTAIIGMETFAFVCELCYYLFKLLLCIVAKLFVIPKCVVFYLIDLFIFVLFMIIVSVLFIIDMIFMLKARVGVGCVESFMMSLKLISWLDDLIYQYISIHVFSYPDPVIQMCYRCSLMGDTKGFWDSAGRLFDDIFITLPDSVGDPLNEVVTGFGHLFSFFDLD